MNTQLTKASTSDELRQYFNAILQLAKDENKFPINLDEVWPLAYAKKSNAVRELKRSFIEGEDYLAENEPLLQNEQRTDKGYFTGENKVSYHLSLSCLEYFIARKVRPVFEVYRQVFHKTAQQQMAPQVPTSFREALLLAAKQGLRQSPSRRTEPSRHSEKRLRPQRPKSTTTMKPCSHATRSPLRK